MESFIKKYSKKILIAILLVFPLLFLSGKWTDSDLGIFPFEATVWGTVSDYVGLLVTVASVYLIFETFKAQRLTLEQQQKSLEHQAEELRLNRLNLSKDLYFKIDVDFHPTRDGEMDVVEFINRGDKIYNVRINPHSDLQIYLEFYNKVISSKSNLNPKYRELEKGHMINLILIKPIDDEEYISLDFSDYFGGKYTKTVRIDRSGRIANLDIVAHDM